MNRIAYSVIALALLCPLFPQAVAQRHHASRGASGPENQEQNCYNQSDPNDIRLWSGQAPGAQNNDPCRDIPFLRVFPADRQTREAGPAILVIPGGGYDRLTDAKEQAPVADYFSHNLKVTTFILYYRLVQADGTYRYPVPMWDGQRALKLIRYLSQRYEIDPNRVGVFGFSAGGHLASTLALHSATDFNLPMHDAVDAMNGRPNILGLGYPVISMNPEEFAAPSSLSHLLYGYRGGELTHLEQYLSGQENITRNTPPVFLFESMDDQRISPQNSVLFAQALHAAQVPADVHMFAHGEHGAGLATGLPEEEAWPDLFRQWLERQHFLQ
jgi:acetyl esterase/lipase